LKSKDEIEKMLKKVEEALKCPRCGEMDPEYDYEGELKCGSCGELLYCRWDFYGVWVALEWVMGLVRDGDFEDYLRSVSYRFRRGEESDGGGDGERHT